MGRLFDVAAWAVFALCLASAAGCTWPDRCTEVQRAMDQGVGCDMQRSERYRSCLDWGLCGDRR